MLLNDAGTGNMVGGVGQGNVISGNTQAGVEITGSPDATVGTAVEGNFIGTDLSGTSAVGNGSYGVLVYGSSANTIGGATTYARQRAGQRDLRQFPGRHPDLQPRRDAGRQQCRARQPDRHECVGDFRACATAATAIQIENASENTIGGSSTHDRNVISGNAGNGVLIDQFPNLSASGNRISGNFIGTDAAGTSALGNLGSGVELVDGSANVVGGIGGGATAHEHRGADRRRAPAI